MITNHEQYFIQIIGDASLMVERFTLQLYLYDKDKPPIPASSAVLIKTYSNRYLITAAHVFIDNPRDSIFILDPGSGGITVAGECIISEIHKNEVSNRTDIAIIQLNEALFPVIDKLKKDYFDITTYNLDYYNKNELYIVYGYPNSKTKLLKGKKKIQTTPFKFLTKQTTHPIKEVDKPWTIQVRFTRNKISRLNTNEINNAPRPVGLSGCGIWDYESILYQKEDGPVLRLKAILIEYIDNRSILICTKMNMITQLLINRFNEQLQPPESLANYNII
ncbi:MAG: S1 family peptidase [Bacteroidota bacterium]|nr:S1 family peptidase [Bacteroidota bacterium]